MPKTSPRPVAPVDLTVSAPAQRPADAGLPRLPYVPWVAAAVAGSAAVVLLGWAVVGALVAAAWLTAPHLAPGPVLDTASQAWLGVHGSAFTLGGVGVRLTPLGLSALLAVAMAAVGRLSFRQTDRDSRSLPGVVLVAAACTGAYAVASWLVASLVGAPRQAVAVFVGALAIGGVGSLVGALREARLDLFGGLPPWTRALPRGAGAGLATLAAASVLTLGVAVGAHTRQISALQGGLGPDAAGAALLVALYAAYLPNVLGWAGSYALGSGLTVGAGTLLTPFTSVLGLVPALPLAGALPAVPPALGWAFLASGPLAGVAAGTVCVRGLRALDPPARIVPWAVRAGAAGLASALVWGAASWLTRGDLGTTRLVGLGPRFPEIGLPLLGMVAAASLTGAVLAWWTARRPQPAAEPLPFGLDDEETVALETAPFGLD